MGICGATITKKSSTIKKNPLQAKETNIKQSQKAETASLETNQEINHNYNNNPNDSSDNQSIIKDLSIKIDADCYKVQYPIYLEKGQEFSFVYMSGKWSFLPEYGNIGYEGYPQIKYNDINIGALCFEIAGGKSYCLNNRMKYIADSSGPLFFFANLNPNDLSYYTPQNSIDFAIKGGSVMSQEKIYHLCGWNIDTINSNTITPREKEVIYYINKLRTVPKLFGKMYMNNLNSNDPRYKDFNRNFFNELTPLPQLKYNESLTKAAKNHADDLGDNGITGHLSSNNNDLKKRIHLHEKQCEYFGENCTYNLGNSLAIAIDMLVDNFLSDKYNQNNILNPSFTDIGICIRKHQAFKWCCVLIFAKLP